MTAISYADTGQQVESHIEEHAALRRVAELVARGAPSEKVFAVVAAELGTLLKVDGAKILRYEHDHTATFLASWGELHAGIPVGARLSYTGTSVTAKIVETGGSARLDDYVTADGQLAAHLHEEGIQSAVGAPILVEGRIWGAMLVGSARVDPLPPLTESRIEEFAELVATAIANLEARAEIERLAEEQGALRRVAELVARQSSADAVFSAVAQEVGMLVGVSSSAVLRFDTDGTLVVVAAWGGPDIARHVGRRLPIAGNNTAALVLQTGRPARMDDHATAQGPIAAIVRDMQIHSTISYPVSVEGRLWGAIAVNSQEQELLPIETEERLAKFTALVATAIANVDARADLAASRARIVAASDEARRRFERNLHDGVQQRLVGLSLFLQEAQAMVPKDLDGPQRQLALLAQGLTDVLEDLRELSRGLHPAILSEGGLEPALRALARRSALPTSLDCRVRGRIDERIEAAAYFVVSEALTNAAKHARASVAEITAQPENGLLRLRIRDDGVGGAVPVEGSGLIGLQDRVEALGGTIVILSPPNLGTQIQVELPLGRDGPPGPRHSI